MTCEQLWRKKIRTIFHNLKGRAKKKQVKLPFLFVDFLLWLNNQPQLCTYCGIPLTPNDVSLDHKMPVSRLGSWDLDNYVLCCLSCNLAKHDLTNSEFQELNNLIRNWPPYARVRLLARLRYAGSAFR